MSFAAPLALIGLIAVALPIGIHLFSRHRARRQFFPTLRFIPISPILPRRRIELTDAVLLAVRIGIIALAAIALAQPRFRNQSSPSTSRISRLIIVDTSRSMQRHTASGERAVDSAMKAAGALATLGAPSLIVQTAIPGAILSGAADWLRAQAGERELVIVSDFQQGVVDSAELDVAQLDAGVRLIRIPVVDSTDQASATISGRFVRMRVRPGLSTATWGAASFPGAAQPSAIIYMEGAQTPSGGLRPIRGAWMARAGQRVHDNPALRAASAISSSRISPPVDTAATVVATDSVGRPLIVASSASSAADHLEFRIFADSGSIAAVALTAALSASLDAAAPIEELDPIFIAPDRLQRWQRPPVGHAVPSPDASGGRWLWTGALLLLLLEWLLRRRRPSDRSEAVNDEMERAA